MGGGLLNLISYGNQNIILSGNPSKTFFKCVYSKYTNFGLQKFRIDCEGSNRKLRETETSTFKFKVPRYADLLMDTYLVMDLPNIWSPILPPTTNNIDNVQPDDPNIYRLVVVGGASLLQGGVTIAVSDDGGINWEAANSSDNIFAEGFDVIWLGNLTNPLWVAVGQPYTGVNNNTIVRSINGRDWTSISNTPFGNNGSGYGIAYDSNNNLLISVGNNDPLDVTSTCIGYSNDLGITWTKITNATVDGIVETINNIFDTGGITAISYGNGMWVAVGITSGIYAPYITSNDGINWIGYNTNLWDNKGFNKTSILHCSGNNWIMGGFATNPPPPDIAKGRILISNDNGISWSNTNLPTEDYAPNRVMSLSINPNNNIILGVGQGANIPGGNQQFYLMSSNDNGLNWTNLLNPLNNCGVTNGITGIFWNSTYNRWNLGGGGCENQLAYNNNLEGLGAWSISEPNGGNNLFPANLVSPVEVRNFAQGFLKGNIHPVIPSLPTLTDIWKPYEFKWIKDLGTQLIERVRFTVGGVTIQEFTGQYLRCMVERDFDNTKKDLYYKMTGNISELNDPANAFQRNGYYPNVYPTNIPNFNIVGPEPSIRARKLYIPLNIWFTLASKMAFPLICLNKQDLNIEVDLRPINELFTVRDIETLIYPTTNSPFLPAPDNGFPNIPSASASVGPHIKANFNNELFKFYRFLQPPTWISKEDDNLLILQDWEDKRTIWNADIHLISTYAFLSDEEIKVFTNKQQNYLVKQVYYFKHENIIESKKVNLFSTSGLVSDWMWYFQRNDVNLRNQWSNYTNWEYDYQPYSIVDPSGCFDIYSQNIVGTPNAASITINSNSLNPANNPGGYITNYKINSNYRLANQKNIMISWGLSLDGKYRENIQDAGVLDYVEKYTRTSGNAHDGLYCYNFCLQTNPLDFQPSGSMNLTDFNQIEFEVKTHLPTLDPNAQSLTICDPSGNFIAINKSNWRIYDYTYDLYIMEERYNILYFEDAKAHLVYAR